MYKATQTRIQTYLNDVAGVRIVCAFIDDNRLDEQIRQAVLSLETKWTEKEIGFHGCTNLVLIFNFLKREK